MPSNKHYRIVPLRAVRDPKNLSAVLGWYAIVQLADAPASSKGIKVEYRTILYPSRRGAMQEARQWVAKQYEQP